MYSIVAKLCLCLLVLAAVSNQSVATQRFCGKALVDVLDSLCINGYNSKIKKSVQMDVSDYAYNDIEDELPLSLPLPLPLLYANAPYLARIEAGTADLFAKTRRRRHGIYDECCRKGCTYSELLSYCL